MSVILKYEENGFVKADKILDELSIQKSIKDEILDVYEKGKTGTYGSFYCSFPYYNSIIHFKQTIEKYQDYSEIITPYFASLIGLNSANYYRSTFLDISGMISFESNNFELINNVLSRFEKEIIINDELKLKYETDYYDSTDLMMFNGFLQMKDVFNWISNKQYNINAYEYAVNQLLKMFVFDMIFLIEDRITKNWGITYNKKYFDIQLFDNSCINALWTGSSDINTDLAFSYDMVSEEEDYLIKQLLKRFLENSSENEVYSVISWLNNYSKLNVSVFLENIEKARNISIPEEIKRGFDINFYKHISSIISYINENKSKTLIYK